MMDVLALKLSYRDIDFDPVDRQVMCFAHVINLATGQALHEVDPKPKVDPKSKACANASDDDCAPVVDDPTLSKPIGLARAVVGVIQASGKHREVFTKVVKDGNNGRYFMEGPKVGVQLKHLQLLRDVPTRWDSVYHMLHRLRIMRPVSFDILLSFMYAEQFFYQAVDHFLALPNNKELAKYIISPHVWSTLRDVEAVLAVSSG